MISFSWALQPNFGAPTMINVVTKGRHLRIRWNLSLDWILFRLHEFPWDIRAPPQAQGGQLGNMLSAISGYQRLSLTYGLSATHQYWGYQQIVQTSCLKLKASMANISAWPRCSESLATCDGKWWNTTGFVRESVYPKMHLKWSQTCFV